jgi:hypothetical protein
VLDDEEEDDEDDEEDEEEDDDDDPPASLVGGGGGGVPGGGGGFGFSKPVLPPGSGSDGDGSLTAGSPPDDPSPLLPTAHATSIAAPPTTRNA